MLRAQAPRVEAMSSQASLLNLSPRLLVVSCRYTTTALPVRRLHVSFPFPEYTPLVLGSIAANLLLAMLWAALHWVSSPHQDGLTSWAGAPFCHSSHAHSGDCSAWLISQCLGNHWPPRRKGCSKLHLEVNRWSPWCIPPREAMQGRAPSFSAFAQPSSLPPHRIFWHRFSLLSETLRKPLGNPRKPSQLQRKPGGNPPLNALTHPLRPYKAFTLRRAFRFWAQTPRRLHSIGRGNTQPQHYDAPCAQQRPTSFNGLRRKSPCGLCSCMTAWKDEPAWRKLNLPHKDASAECRRKGTIHRFSQFVPNWLWYWRMLDMQNQTGTTAPNLNQYMNLKQIIRHLWTTAW